ncbi:7-carboxy-7-deazaguanine synthase QueE [Paenibacillus eucommiae]|uniref:7-carboxy-7-deazaguanine synthase n=1 Tax=Paenibacillus eucommiae TaxID=1355755 RepID=A0ABS4J8R0_9BACL|nr:7-carboxy-7-deazaguanine synthase QueE [Paenibacillus eucommiae]MBP1996232.1 7-carboxy-7-deazaguanine synthase [Paenibacillus eucommiae]
MHNSRFPVIEMFGPTIQGEGMVIGQKTMFVRTAGCDYQCSWCDSAFTWNGLGKKEVRMLTAADIAAELKRLAAHTCSHVTISGGNPALLPHLEELINLLHESGIQVALETQGSLWKDWFLLIDDLTLSPKPPSSGMKTDWDKLDVIIANLKAQRRNFSLKVVVFDQSDLAYAASVHKRYDGIPFYVQSGNEDVLEEDTGIVLGRLMDKYKWLVDTVIASTELNNVRVLPQLHAWLWGNKRGY